MESILIGATNLVWLAVLEDDSHEPVEDATVTMTVVGVDGASDLPMEYVTGGSYSGTLSPAVTGTMTPQAWYVLQFSVTALGGQRRPSRRIMARTDEI